VSYAKIFCLISALVAGCGIFSFDAFAKKRRAPAGGRTAIVVDERLAVLREAPDLSANSLRRLGRGRAVSVTGAKRAPDGVLFYRVVVTRRTGGWVQTDALVSAARRGDDRRLLGLIRGSAEFDRISRAQIFLELFRSSEHRPAVLLLYAEAAEEAARRLSRDAARRLEEGEMRAGGAPAHSYFMNFSGLDRYRRHGVVFTFDAAAKRFHYDGAAWREILRRHPRSPEAAEARRRLDVLPTPARE
jgi:hypothetical protein